MRVMCQKFQANPLLLEPGRLGRTEADINTLKRMSDSRNKEISGPKCEDSIEANLL